MPNHFHFMIVPNESACVNIVLGEKLTDMQSFSRGIGKTLSSYTKAVNIQNKSTGNLFQKKTQAKSLTMDEENFSCEDSHDGALNCFHYIHNNPLAANLVMDLKEWIYSSYPDYY
ncbi:MAG: hypothetical protein ABI683_05610 [Ginsengibacter sp.]